jgi:Na+/melibiose symporter-like transporter
MSAGLPGVGLGGLFFIFSALAAPFPELWRTARGRSSAAAWRAILRQLAQALTMIVAVDLMLRLAGAGLRLDLIGITTGILVAVICLAKAAELALRARPRRALRAGRGVLVELLQER